LTCDGPKVIEFNVRFGDPEAQVLIPMIDGALMPLLLAAADGALESHVVRLSRNKHVGVVLASEGYPARASAPTVVSGLDRAAAIGGVLVFHAGTARGSNGTITTAGGRVLTIVGRGGTYEEAIERAYAGVATITFEGMQFRNDIGRKALAT
jgi:phosphoribosylamine--glycine ligase